MSCVKHALYDALEQKYISDKANAIAISKLSFENPVAIGEHPTLLTDMDKLVSDIATAEENLASLRNNFAEDMMGGASKAHLILWAQSNQTHHGLLQSMR